MYSDRELNRLAAHKAQLRAAIARRRLLLATDFAAVTRPLGWIDRALAWWRKVSPLAKLAAVPLGAYVGRRLLRRLRFLGPLLRWTPLALNLVRGFRAGTAARA